jgi:hypothetical protein
MADAYAYPMSTTVNVNQSIKNLIYFLALGGALLATSFARGEDRATRATVGNVVHVRQVSGAAEYAYDSTGWRPLVAGKILHAGASVRTGNSATVVLAMEESGSLVRVGPMRKLELAAAAPASESPVTIVPLQAKILKATTKTTTVAANDF